MNFSELISICAFLILLATILLFDLGVLSKTHQEPSYKESLFRTAIWFFLALLFTVFLWFNGSIFHGINTTGEINTFLSRIGEKNIQNGTYSGKAPLVVFNHNLAISFLNGYFVEYSLSMDNILVIILIFSGFKVERKYYHKVLFWGILGAVVMRATFIFVGTTLIQHFHWILYVFGAFLVFSGGSMFLNRKKEESLDSETHPVVQTLSKLFPIEKQFQGDRFFIRKNSKLYLTPLLVVLLVIEFTDLIFAVDSIPAVFSITRDPYIVFFSNIFAIMGLRSLFFLMEKMVDRFHFLKTGLSILLIIIGVKMIFPGFFEKIGFNNWSSLALILFILGGSILLSLWVTQKRDSENTIHE